MRLIRLLAPLVAFTTAAAQNPAAIEHKLRYGVRIADQPDIALDIVDRMKSYHIPGLSLAIIDNCRVVYAKGFGVAEFGGTKRVDHHAVSRRLHQQARVCLGVPAARRRAKALARRRRQHAAEVVASARQPLHRAREGDTASPAHALGGTHGVGFSRLRAGQAGADRAATARRSPPPTRPPCATTRSPARAGSTPAAASPSFNWRRATSHGRGIPGLMRRLDASAGAHDAKHI